MSSQPPLRNPYDPGLDFFDSSSRRAIRPVPAFNPQTAGDSDAPIRQTNSDATLCRASAAAMGYFQDPYAAKFLTDVPLSRRSPVINRGTFIRFEAVGRAIERFIFSCSGQCQIVSLGAGSDSRFFLLKDKNITISGGYFELDFPEITRQKRKVLMKNAKMLSMLGPLADAHNCDTSNLHSDKYHLLGVDLRKWDETVPKLIQSGFRPEIPTLVLSECVLIYMDAEFGDRIIQWFGQQVPSAAFITYEQILPDDAFGRVMLQNLEQRGVDLKSIRAYPTLEAQLKRYLDRGFSSEYSISQDMYTVSRTIMVDQEIIRLNKIEMLDEWEELTVLNKHYSFLVATKNTPQSQHFLENLFEPLSKQ